MKITEINYSKVFNLGGYQNEKIGCVIQVDENDNASEAMKAAVAFVEKQHADKIEYRKAKLIIQNPAEYKVKELEAARELVAKWEYNNDLPF